MQKRNPLISLENWFKINSIKLWTADDLLFQWISAILLRSRRDKLQHVSHRSSVLRNFAVTMGSASEIAPKRSKLDLLAEIGALTQGYDLRNSCHAALSHIAVGRNSDRVAMCLNGVERRRRIPCLQTAEFAKVGMVEAGAEFPIESGGVVCGQLRIARATSTLTKDERAFVLTAACLLAGAPTRAKDWKTTMVEAGIKRVSGLVSAVVYLFHCLRSLFR